MKSAIPSIAVLFTVFSAAGQQSQLTRKELAQPTVIQAYPCAKGYTWFFPDGKLEQCAISEPIAFGEAQIPAGSVIVLRPDGKPRHVFLARDAYVLGYNVRGGGLLGPSTGFVTTFYADGKLSSIYLVDDQIIQGVPCRGGEWGIFTDPVGGGNRVEFYEDGKLRSCKVTHDYAGRHAGQRVIPPR